MKAHWDQVTLTAHWWDGAPAKAGDGFITTTGRKYLIVDIAGKRFRCLVLPPEETISGTWHSWYWSSRGKQ